MHVEVGDNSPCIPQPHALSVLVIDHEIDVAQAPAEWIEFYGHRDGVASDSDAALSRVAADHRLATRVVLVFGDVAAERAGSPEPPDGPTLAKPSLAGEVKALLDRYAP